MSNALLSKVEVRRSPCHRADTIVPPVGKATAAGRARRSPVAEAVRRVGSWPVGSSVASWPGWRCESPSMSSSGPTVLED